MTRSEAAAMDVLTEAVELERQLRDLADQLAVFATLLVQIGEDGNDS